ncbi:MAG: hypothetical protein U0174_07720 [Polyangiaceae bacterium]
MKLLSAFALCALTLTACSKKEDGPAPTPSATTLPLAPLGTTSIVGTPGSASASAPAASGSAAAAGSPAAADYTGTYKATAGTLYVPEEKDWKGFRFRGEDAGTGLGDGTISIKVKDGGRVEGEGDGPFGKFILSGVVAESNVSAAVLRKDPTDGGFTGFLIGTKKGDGFEGTMKLSLAQGNVLRDATFTVKK